MKTVSILETALITGLFFSGSATAEGYKEPAEWLFVHTALTSEMTSATTLDMPVTRDIFAFTDRPNRQHGYMTADQFVTLWDEGEGDTFKADAPNAVLTWVEGGEIKETEVLITDAIVVGEESHSIRYMFSVEVGEMASGSTATQTSLFVDGQHLRHTLNEGLPGVNYSGGGGGYSGGGGQWGQE